jgi:hypothetical protein
VGFRGLVILSSGRGPTTFVASTVETGGGSTVPPNHLALFVDSGGPYAGGSSGATNVGVLVAQAPTGTVYRGLALSPN